MTLAANLTFLFQPGQMWERIDAAADAGFSGIEILQPYDEDPDDLRHTLEAAGPGLVLINTPEPAWDTGGRGYAAVPGAEDTFRAGIETALTFADAAACPRIHILAGLAEGTAARDAYLANLAWAADRAPEMAFSIEPLNALDQPGYFLNDFDQAAEILDTLNRPNVGLQFDTYHAHRMTGDAAAVWSTHGKRTVHVQVAGQTRAAPGPDEVALMKRMRDDGYQGWIAAEYMPGDVTEDSLDWMGDFAP